MEKQYIKFSIYIAAIQIVFTAAFIPVLASAHYTAVASGADMVAAVGADGHDHEHEPAPVVASDGHTDHAHAPGGSDILKPGSSRWVGLLLFSIIATSGLSYAVYRYVQVAPVDMRKLGVEEEKK